MEKIKKTDIEKIYLELEEKFGIENEESLIKNIKELLTIEEIDDKMKSKALSLIGDIVCILAPYLEEDSGYSFYKEALTYDFKNYNANIGICLIFLTYPYPLNKILTELEFMDSLKILVNDLNLLNEIQKNNTLEILKNYIEYRETFIKKYNYNY